VICTAILALSLLSQRIDAGLPALDRLVDSVAQEREEDIRAKAMEMNRALEERQFLEKYDHLLHELQELANDYQRTHVIDAKKLRSIEKAYHALESVDPWFKLDK
jgi:hypothetical protein